jgi:hypothetical protein
MRRSIDRNLSAHKPRQDYPPLMAPVRMVPLTSAANTVEARIIAAHLGAAGLLWELRGNVDGPYPVGQVDILVEADDLDVARELVLHASPADGFIADADVLRAPRELWFVLLAVLVLAAFTLVRVLAAAG